MQRATVTSKQAAQRVSETDFVWLFVLRMPPFVLSMSLCLKNPQAPSGFLGWSVCQKDLILLAAGMTDPEDSKGWRAVARQRGRLCELLGGRCALWEAARRRRLAAGGGRCESGC